MSCISTMGTPPAEVGLKMRVDSPPSSGRECRVPIPPQEEAGLKLKLERNPGVLPQFERHGFPPSTRDNACKGLQVWKRQGPVLREGPGTQWGRS